MLNILLFFCVIISVVQHGIASANDLDWVGEKIPPYANIKENSPAIGEIDGQPYIAIQLDIGESYSDFKPALIFASIKDDYSYEPFAIWSIQNINSRFTVDIRNNSIYVRDDTAHHGVYSSIYQFKLLSGIFQLVGLEHQSITPIEPEEQEKNFHQSEFWSGESINFLTNKAIVWAEKFDLEKPNEYKQWEAAFKRHRKGLATVNGKRKIVSIKKNSLISLDKFDPDTFRLDFEFCYGFNYKLQIHNYCQK